MSHIKWVLSKDKAFFIFVLMLFSSCLYEPFDVYENPVNTAPTAPEIDILELNINADTLWIYEDQILKYHFESLNEEQRILGLNIYIDGVIRDSVMSDNGSFYILQSALSQGKHTMNVVLYTKAGTGSIADRLDAEAMLLSKEWVVIADYSKKNVTHTVENGYLKLHWDEYKNLDLKSYRIQYSVTTENNYYVDSLYLGAEKTFYVDIVKTDGSITRWGSLDLDENIPKLEFKIADDNTYYFTWTKSPYYNAVKYRYELNNSDDESIPYGSYYGFKSVDDTIYVSNMYFSDYFNFTLHTLPKNLTEYANDYMIYPRSYMLQYAGEPANVRDYTTYTSADTLTALDDENVYKYFLGGETVYNTPINNGISYGLGHLQVSPRGKFLLGKYYALNGTGMNYFAKELRTGKILQMDFVDPNYTLHDYRYGRGISDNGIGIFILSKRVFIYDFINNIEIASKTFSSQSESGTSFKIAPDGKHYIALVNSDLMLLDVYKINAPNLEKMYSLESGTTSWEFNPTDPNMITSVKDNILSVIQCEPYVLLRTIEFASDEVFMNIDYFNNEILSINANQFIIRSLNDGNVLKRIAKRPERYYLYENFKLHNHHIIKDNVMLKTHQYEP